MSGSGNSSASSVQQATPTDPYSEVKSTVTLIREITNPQLKEAVGNVYAEYESLNVHNSMMDEETYLESVGDDTAKTERNKGNKNLREKIGSILANGQIDTQIESDETESGYKTIKVDLDEFARNALTSLLSDIPLSGGYRRKSRKSKGRKVRKSSRSMKRLNKKVTTRRRRTSRR